MPRVAELDPGDQKFPWEDWRKQLMNSPTGALIFDRDDFGTMKPRRFREKAKEALGDIPDVQVRVRGSYVVVLRHA